MRKDGHNWLNVLCTRFCSDDRAAQIVEFAVALPLLILFVVGIFDFSSAFTLKQKLTNVARDAARAAAADPVTDLQVDTLPASASHAFQVINNYFVANKMNNCGIDPGIYLQRTNAPYWTFTGTVSCPPGGMVIIINRGYFFPADPASAAPPDATCTSQVPAAGTLAVVATCVSIQYAYKWQFGKAASLFGSATTLPTSLTVTAVAMNEN